MKRQAMHVAFGTASAFLVWKEYADWKLFAALLLIGVGLSLLSRKHSFPFIQWFLNNFERKNAIPGQGALFLVFGIAVVLLLFPKNTALAAIMIVALGDSSSHLAGRLFGRIRNPLNKYKLVEGTIVGIILGSAGASLFAPLHIAAAASTVAMVFESVEIKFKRAAVDDNLLIPLLAAIVIHLMNGL